MIETIAEVLFEMTYLTHIVASYRGLGMLRIAAMLWNLDLSLSEALLLLWSGWLDGGARE